VKGKRNGRGSRMLGGELLDPLEHLTRRSKSIALCWPTQWVHYITQRCSGDPLAEYSPLAPARMIVGAEKCLLFEPSSPCSRKFLELVSPRLQVSTLKKRKFKN